VLRWQLHSRSSSALSSVMSHRSAERRLRVLAAHLTPDGERVQASTVVPSDASGAPYASATGAPSSYAKVSVCVCVCVVCRRTARINASRVCTC